MTRQARTPSSMLSLPEFAGQSKQTYVEAAVGLANDLDRLTALRSGLRERMRTSPLCDADAFARNVETADRDMWRTWCNTDVGHE